MSIMTIAWQGGGVVSNVMKEIGPGTYRTTQEIPAGGSWKTVFRMQLGRRLLAGDADFAEGTPSPRWWGGTELTSRRQWRWDAAARKLHSLT